jgi:hypothetical protein
MNNSVHYLKIDDIHLFPHLSPPSVNKLYNHVEIHAETTKGTSFDEPKRKSYNSLVVEYEGTKLLLPKTPKWWRTNNPKI